MAAVGRLQQVAKELREAPHSDGDPVEVASFAGRKLREAIRLGAFGGDEYAPLRNRVEQPRARPDVLPNELRDEYEKDDDLRAWHEAVLWFCKANVSVGQQMAYAVGATQMWADACPQMADLLDKEAERLDRTDDFGGPSDARQWLVNHVRPIIRSLHECIVRETGYAVTNTSITPIYSVPLTPERRENSLSLIRQHVNVVRDWALRSNLANVPSAPPRLPDREAAQALFSEWASAPSRLNSGVV